jgi:aminopeptidase N
MVNGGESTYRFDSEHIVIPAAELVRGRNEIGIVFAAGQAALNRNPGYVYTLFVPDRARTVFPVFDQPDLKATFELTLNLPAEWRALANAPVESVVEAGTRRVHSFRRTERISPYLFAFVAGEFEAVTRRVGGRTMTMLHRETDAAKVERNVDDIFALHASAIDFHETWTDIEYPFQKLDFALIPAFQYGGMEHVGSIFYRASGLLLEEAPSDVELLNRARTIAHETAHMWFGDLVTMRWFDDVWMKEVFANFMAAKAVNPSFPAIDHDLAFLVDHYPPAYSVDRTAGANAIRQPLANLAEAGQLYGPIIYNKAPIMMRELEALVGEEPFRDGLREYLSSFAFGNADWPGLVDILDRRTDHDLRAWSDVWVNTPGRPEFDLVASAAGGPMAVVQRDPSGLGRVWPQTFSILVDGGGDVRRSSISAYSAETPLAGIAIGASDRVVLNADGRGYGAFPAQIADLALWDELTDVEQAALLVNLNERLLAQAQIDQAVQGRSGSGGTLGARELFTALEAVAGRENNQLVAAVALDQARRIFWTLLAEDTRDAAAAGFEEVLWRVMSESPERGARRLYFWALVDIALTPAAVGRLHAVWSRELTIEGLTLSEEDEIALARTLAIKLPGQAAGIVADQLARIANPDNRRRLEFIAPSLSPDEATRDAFFATLADERNRAVEPWVLEALAGLHHPLRVAQAEKYLRPSLDLLEEIRVTGDIFFPERWLLATFANHRSAGAVRVVREFLAERPDYDPRLTSKILQAADPMFRANALLEVVE